MLKQYGLDANQDPELEKLVAGSGINHSGSTTLKYSMSSLFFLTVTSYLMFSCHEAGAVSLVYASQHQLLISAGKKGTGTYPFKHLLFDIFVVFFWSVLFFCLIWGDVGYISITVTRSYQLILLVLLTLPRKLEVSVASIVGGYTICIRWICSNVIFNTDNICN